MIQSIFITIIFLNEFIAFLYASERLRLYDIISGRHQDELTKKERRVMMNLAFRFFFGITYLGFIIYGLFVPELFIYCILTLAIAVVSFLLMYKLSKRGNSLKERIWVARFDAILTMMVWFAPLVQIIRMIF